MVKILIYKCLKNKTSLYKLKYLIHVMCVEFINEKQIREIYRYIYSLGLDAMGEVFYFFNAVMFIKKIAAKIRMIPTH